MDYLICETTASQVSARDRLLSQNKFLSYLFYTHTCTSESEDLIEYRESDHAARILFIFFIKLKAFLNYVFTQRTMLLTKLYIFYSVIKYRVHSRNYSNVGAWKMLSYTHVFLEITWNDDLNFSFGSSRELYLINWLTECRNRPPNYAISEAGSRNSRMWNFSRVRLLLIRLNSEIRLRSMFYNYR